MRRSLRSSRAVWLLAIALSVAVGSIRGHSQTTLAWPESQIDIGKYESLERCLAAVRRVTDSVRVRNEVAEDTLEQSMLGDTLPLAESVTSTTQRCLSRYESNRIPHHELSLAQQLYLVAGYDSDAEIVSQRWLRSVPAADTAAHAAILDSIVTGYLNAKPARLAMAHTYLERLARIRDLLPIERRVVVYLLMTQKSKQYNNEAFVNKYGEEFLSIVQNTSDEERSAPGADLVKMAVYLVVRILHHDEFMDSLSSGNASYARMQRVVIGRIMGVEPDDVPNVISGIVVPEIKGEFVYPEASRNDRIPRPNKVSLLVMVGSRAHGSRENFVRNAILHRMKRKFPAIDIVLLAGTSGTVAPLAPLTPSDDAALTNEMFRKYQALPATLLVSTTPFTRISNFDRRVITMANPMASSLSLQHINDGGVFLVDSSGQFVENMLLYEETEQLLSELIRVVLERDSRSK